MKTIIQGLFTAALCFSLAPAFAQGGRPGGGTPQISAAMAKLFGDNQAFSANVESEIKMSRAAEPMTLPGKMSFDNGKTRFEMSLSEAKGGGMEASAAQMKSMGMDQMVVISRPDEKTSYMIYPGLKAYAPMPEARGAVTNAPEDFKIETTKLGEETVAGHPCIKNKAVVTDAQGKKYESTIWNATDLKNFPVKIQTVEQGTDLTMTFNNVKLGKPAATQFDPPSDFKKYDNFMAMMQQEVMKRMQQQQGGMGE